jgi:hypothetical protein
VFDVRSIEGPNKNRSKHAVLMVYALLIFVPIWWISYKPESQFVGTFNPIQTLKQSHSLICFLCEIK